MAFQSIGQRLGFVSAGDERRAMEREVRSLRAKNAAQVAKIKRKDAALADKDISLANQAAALADQAAEIASQAVRIRELEAALAAK